MLTLLPHPLRLGAMLLLVLIQSACVLSDGATAPADAPFLNTELIFPLEGWHNHGSCLVETPQGDLVACWFHGSGERTADDALIEGARLRRGHRTWSPRFVMADTPGFPDTNCAMFIDPQGRLWLLWPTIQANTWESALMKYKIAREYRRDGPPRWEISEVLHVKPGPEFEAAVAQALPRMTALARQAELPEAALRRIDGYLSALAEHATNKLYRRLGWMTRAHPFVLDGQRLIVPLYHDGFSFSLMAITDDWGHTWHTSAPLVGGGNIQPSLVRRRDGSLYTLMRDNGPPPKRLHQSSSTDRGETWSAVTDSAIPNPGSGAEIIGLRNGHWAVIGNDTETGRHSLAVQISDDEGRTWKWRRHLELDPGGSAGGSFSYPSILQSTDGSLHATYSFHPRITPQRPPDASGRSPDKSIRHAHFNEAWVLAGDLPSR